MSDHPFFYAKVDVDALKQISSNGEIKLKPVDPPYETYFSLPLPKQVFSATIPVSNPHLITDTVLYKTNLNPKSIFFQGALLSIGTLYELEGEDGLWCLITHCSECFREFLGFTRVNNADPYQQEKMKIIRCSTPNCANNLMFRQKVKQDQHYVGK